MFMPRLDADSMRELFEFSPDLLCSSPGVLKAACRQVFDESGEKEPLAYVHAVKANRKWLLLLLGWNMLGLDSFSSFSLNLFILHL